MELTNDELKDFRERALQASIYGHQIGLAELYVESLAAEVGHSDVAADVTPASATHLLALANEALELRAHGKKPKRSPKKTEEVKPAKSEPPPAPPEEPKAEVPPPPPEEPKAEVPAEPKPEELAAEETEAEDESEEESEETEEAPEESVNATTGSVAPKAAKKKAKKKAKKNKR